MLSMTPPESLPNLDEVFLDTIEMTVDNKGRVGIPEKFMKVIRKLCPDNANVIGIAPTPEKSIKLMPYSYIARRIADWSKLNGEKGAERKMLNALTAYATWLPLDPQNRIKLNPTLMRLCRIQRDVVIVGSIHFMQLFDVHNYEETVLTQLANYDEIEKEAERKIQEVAPVQFVLNTSGAPAATKIS